MFDDLITPMNFHVFYSFNTWAIARLSKVFEKKQPYSPKVKFFAKIAKLVVQPRLKEKFKLKKFKIPSLIYELAHEIRLIAM